MKNIYLIPSETKTRLVKVYSDAGKTKYSLHLDIEVNDNYKEYVNLYITSDEEIKDCWVLNSHTNEVYFLEGYYGIQPIAKKIILTTDPDLIKDGVQEISEEFLQWFVKNDNCEFVEVKKKGISDHMKRFAYYKYQIIIPQEEPKQETLNLDKLESQLDNTLEKETKESLSEWLYTKRQRESLEAGEKFANSLSNSELNEIMKEFDNKTNEYPIGGYAPGEYACKCVTCKEIFKGDKRAVQCKDCAVNEREEPKTNLEKLQFPELVEEFANYYKEVPLVEKHEQECEYIKEFGCVKDICTCNSNPKKAPFKHECRVISKEEILEDRSNAYNFLDFSKQETVEEAIKRLIIEPTLEDMQIFEAGVKWAQKQNNKLYSEEDLRKAYCNGWITRERFDDLSPDIIYPKGLDYEEKREYAFNLWLKQFKKK